MATNNNDEEYLDSLLNAVIGDSKEDSKENTHIPEEEGYTESSEKEQVSEDAFAMDAYDIGLDSDGVLDAISDEGIEADGEGIPDIDELVSEQIPLDEPEQLPEESVAEPEVNLDDFAFGDLTSDVEIDKELSEVLDDGMPGSNDEAQAPKAETADEDIDLPDGFEDIFSDASLETAGSTSDEDMQGLYDIFGMNDASGEDSAKDVEDIELLEAKPKKKKKEKKKRKGLFGRKKASKEEAVEDNEDVFEIFGAGAEANQSETVGQSVEQDDLGLGEFGDMFMGNTAEEEPYEESYEEEKPRGGFFDDDDDDYEEEEEPKKKKEKKKKEKKKKEKKPPKEKKPKKVKEPKPKKPKKPKEPDVIIKVPKPLLIFLLSFVIMLVVALVVGGNYYNYKEKTDAAVSYYLNQEYDKAYEELSGLSMHEDDEFFYDKLETIMFVERHYTSYKSLYELRKYDQGLHTLLRGVKMYDKYKDIAREYDCFEDVTVVLGWIETALKDNYGITLSQARELNLIEDRYEYADKVYEISDVLKEKQDAIKDAESEAKQEAQ